MKPCPLGPFGEHIYLMFHSFYVINIFFFACLSEVFNPASKLCPAVAHLHLIYQVPLLFFGLESHPSNIVNQVPELWDNDLISMNLYYLAFPMT